MYNNRTYSFEDWPRSGFLLLLFPLIVRINGATDTRHIAKAGCPLCFYSEVNTGRVLVLATHRGSEGPSMVPLDTQGIYLQSMAKPPTARPGQKGAQEVGVCRPLHGCSLPAGSHILSYLIWGVQ